MSDQNPILKLNHISKHYPGVKALDDLTIDFIPGEIHAIVGENGAGKSTMIKTITGAIKPTGGTIEINSQIYKYMTPALSRKNGIAVVYQEFALIPVLSAAENIFFGEFKMKGLSLDQKQMNQKARELFNMMNIDIDPKTKVEDLTTGYQQVVEIAKSISKEANILIMDEPSAPLTNSEVDAMISIVELLKKQGVTVIYISHRLEEIFRISDRVSVLRDGQYISTLRTRDTNKKELIKLMVGRELAETYPKRSITTKEPLLSLKGVTGNGVKDISFDVKGGEILGLGGLIGAGRTELVQMLFGYEKIQSGEIYLKGQKVNITSPQSAIEQGIALVPEDRKLQGLILEMNIKENTTLPGLGQKMSRMTVVDPQKEIQVTDKYIEALKIKTPSPLQKVKNLSGGNQQKIVLAKWLAMNPDVLIFDEPTRGIDVGAKYEIYLLMSELVEQGKAIIIISSEMEELIGMSDRIVVLCRGRMAGILCNDQFDREKILAKLAGGYDDQNEEKVI